jgi:hypothetical protein
MNWTALFVAAAFGGIVAARIVATEHFRASRPGRIRRVLTASAAVPLVLALLTLIAVIWARLTQPEYGEGNRDVVTFVLVLIGGVSAIVTLVGGLVGAALAERRFRP